MCPRTCALGLSSSLLSENKKKTTKVCEIGDRESYFGALFILWIHGKNSHIRTTCKLGGHDLPQIENAVFHSENIFWECFDSFCEVFVLKTLLYSTKIIFEEWDSVNPRKEKLKRERRIKERKKKKRKKERKEKKKRKETKKERKERKKEKERRNIKWEIWSPIYLKKTLRKKKFFCHGGRYRHPFFPSFLSFFTHSTTIFFLSFFKISKFPTYEELLADDHVTRSQKIIALHLAFNQISALPENFFGLLFFFIFLLFIFKIHFSNFQFSFFLSFFPPPSKQRMALSP